LKIKSNLIILFSSILKMYKQIDIAKSEDIKTTVTEKAFVVVGNVDAGKSTLIGCLTTGTLDDGRGLARKSVARHLHELRAGKTSDISTRIIRYEDGRKATLIDLCGHEKYFSTTAAGISGLWPDYGLIVCSPARGILDMTRQHFRMLMSLNIPLIIVVTRVDSSIDDSCELLNRDIRRLCKTYRKTVEFVNNYTNYRSYARGKALDQLKHMMDNFTVDDLKDYEHYLKYDQLIKLQTSDVVQGLSMSNGKQIHISVVYCSNVDGYYLDLIANVIRDVPTRDLWNTNCENNGIFKYFINKLDIRFENSEHRGSTFYIDSAFQPKGIGLVLSGINRGRVISVGDTLLIGSIKKEFLMVKIKSIHNDDRVSVRSLDHHHRGCVQIKPVDGKIDIRKNIIKRGMVMISDRTMLRNVCYRFEAAISVFGTHSTTIRTGYSPLINAGTIRQSAKLFMESDMMRTINHIESNNQTTELRPSDVHRVTFKFIMHPEYIERNMIFVFRSGDVHGVGVVLNILDMVGDPDAMPETSKKKQRITNKQNN